jgi:hypothetical protein
MQHLGKNEYLNKRKLLCDFAVGHVQSAIDAEDHSPQMQFAALRSMVAFCIATPQPLHAQCFGTRNQSTARHAEKGL